MLEVLEGRGCMTRARSEWLEVVRSSPGMEEQRLEARLVRCNRRRLR